MLDASFDGALSSKSYEEGYKMIESITSNIYQWLVKQAAIIVVPKKSIGVYEVTKTISYVSQVAQIHQMMKNMMTSSNTLVSEPVKDVFYANVVAYF